MDGMRASLAQYDEKKALFIVLSGQKRKQKSANALFMIDTNVK